ncbi:PAS domain-containing protein [Mameliella alba]|uniref:PAS domain-containing protein n=1 Tax=Mameliella alba TaxID=561184 RepID=UPI000B537165|nr:PAS domain-containing protein [Mameliella alba]MBY6118898.1 PAS domain-containing protein [Mameliella alba]OWV43822.1 chemotaxis protein [Mameliella alba]OWV67492.1 chemotaxis protein [Mameliella alba]
MTEHNPRFAAESNFATTEAQFHLTELFYSRTDERGIIKAGNCVFQRVAAYPWEEMLGAPHKLIRHPDMPKGVFHLLWDRIKAGKPTGAYVKNRSKSGRYYWVFALVSPADGGYISTRIKPSSELFATVSGLYADLLRREMDDGLSPRDSAEALLAAVRAQGFSSYDTFQSHALATEFEARATATGQGIDPLQRRFLEMSRAIAQVGVETADLTESFKVIRTVPMNMRIIASRLENAGGAISAISVNYSQMLEEMSTWVKTFVDGDTCVFARMRDAILCGQFLGFATAVEHEMIECFDTNAALYPDCMDAKVEMAEVAAHRQKFLDETVASLVRVEAEAKRFARSVLDMKRYVTGLSSTRMMCKIESASLSESRKELEGIVEQLDACQKGIEQRLARMTELNAVIQTNTAMLRAML